MPPKFQRVMIIDDNEFDSYITSKLILNSNLSAYVLEYNSAEAALLYFEENQNNLEKLPQLIFLDIYMPLMDGFEFIQKFKELSSDINEYCKICMVSTTVSDYYIHKAKIDESIMLFTSKPITVEFIETISDRN